MSNLISDFHGSITTASEADQNKAIGYGILADTIRGLKRGYVFELFNLGKLLVAKKRTEKALAAYSKGEGSLADVYKHFNGAIRGYPTEYVKSKVYQYTRESSGQVDLQLLRVIEDLHSNGVNTGILSVGYEDGIRMVLNELRRSDVFDIIVGNQLLNVNGRCKGFTLDIYEKKAATFEERFLRRLGLDPNKTFYIGNDSKDDGPVADLLPKGHLIAAPMATDIEKQALASRWGAVVPKDHAELERYLFAA